MSQENVEVVRQIYEHLALGNFQDLQSADNPVAILNLATDHGTTYRSVGSVNAGYRLPFFESVGGCRGRLLALSGRRR